MSSISKELLEILACPVAECRAKLVLRNDWLVCIGCGRRYRLEERWPVLIPEEAEPPKENEPTEEENK